MNIKDLSKNSKMIAVTEWLQEASPTLFLITIILAYLVNAVISTVTLSAAFSFFVPVTGAYVITGAASFCFQFFRGTMVLGGFLHPGGDTRVPGIVKFISTLAFFLAFFEVFFSLLVVPNVFHRISLILFAESFVLAGYAAEMFYISRAHRVINEQVVSVSLDRREEMISERERLAADADKLSSDREKRIDEKLARIEQLRGRGNGQPVSVHLNGNQ